MLDGRHDSCRISYGRWSSANSEKTLDSWTVGRVQSKPFVGWSGDSLVVIAIAQNGGDLRGHHRGVVGQRRGPDRRLEHPGTSGSRPPAPARLSEIRQLSALDDLLHRGASHFRFHQQGLRCSAHNRHRDTRAVARVAPQE